MDQAQIFEYLHQIFAEVFERDDQSLRPSLSSADVPGWDSLKHVEILISVEERFDIQLESQQIDALRNVGELVGLIASRLAQRVS